MPWCAAKAASTAERSAPTLVAAASLLDAATLAAGDAARFHGAAAEGRRPVALATGLLERRSQTRAVAVLTESWDVLCFDASLRLLWERSLLPEFRISPGASGTVLRPLPAEGAALRIVPASPNHASGQGTVLVGGAVADAAGGAGRPGTIID